MLQSPMSDIRFAMTSVSGSWPSTTLRTNDTEPSAPSAAVTSEVAYSTASNNTPGVSVIPSSITAGLTTPPYSDWSWTTSTVVKSDVNGQTMVKSDVTASLLSPSSTGGSEETAVGLSASSSDQVDVAYQRLTNLAVIVAVYSLVVVTMIVFACRRRRTSVDYWPARDCTDRRDSDDDDSTVFRRYWDTRRHLAERQRLLDSLRVDNISSVAAGHLIDRLPEHVV